MNIGFITTEYYNYTRVGGIASALGSLVDELTKLGHNVVIITRSDGNRSISKKANLTVYPVVSKGITVTIHFPWLVSRLLPKIIHNHKLDIVETTLTRFPTFFSARAKREVPLVLRIYTSLSTLLGGRTLRKKLNKAIHYWGELDNLFRADALSIASQASFEKIMEHYKLNSNKITMPVEMIPIGIPFEKTQISKQEAKTQLYKKIGVISNDNPFIILYVGAMHFHKGVDLIIKAAKWFEQNNSRVRFVLIGSGNIYQFTESANLPTNCTFLGAVDDNQKDIYMRGADTILIPSRWESFGIVSLEAMSRETPLIAGKTGGLKEIVKDGETGWLVNHTEEDIIDKINIIMSMPPSELQVITDRALQHFKTNFDIKSTTQQYLKFYEKIIKLKKQHEPI